MRKGIVSTCMFILTVMFLGCSDQDSVLDALSERSGYKAIFHHEKVENGMVVFYEPDIGGASSVAASFVQKTSSGWQETKGNGGHSIDPNAFTTSQMILQSNEDSPFPVLFGEITNPDVEEVKIKLGKTEMQPKMIHTQGHRIWYVFVDESAKYSTFLIEGLSKDHEVIDTLEHVEGQSSSASNEIDSSTK